MLSRLDVLVGAVSLVPDDEVHVGRISPGIAVPVDPDASPFELILEDPGRRLIIKAGDDQAQHLDSPIGQTAFVVETCFFYLISCIILSSGGGRFPRFASIPGQRQCLRRAYQALPP